MILFREKSVFWLGMKDAVTKFLSILFFCETAAGIRSALHSGGGIVIWQIMVTKDRFHQDDRHSDKMHDYSYRYLLDSGHYYRSEKQRDLSLERDTAWT